MPRIKFYNDKTNTWEYADKSIGSSGNVDLTGYAKIEDIPTKPEDIGAQPVGDYLTEVPSGYATEEYVRNKIAEAELGGEEVDLSGYAQKSELPTKVSQLENDKGYLTQHQDISGKLDASALPTAINTALAQAKASGEFDGKDGVDGQPGKDGYTPQKNIDYFDGKDGKDGQDGYTPQKNVDYFDGQPGKDGVDGVPGTPGVDGITPHIGSNGNWYIGDTDTGKPSRGANGQPGQNGSPGADGSPGKDGVSATHSWNGTVLTVTSASGTSSADLKGAKGDKGDSIKGDPGADGVSPTVAVSKSGKVTTVSITDKNGTKTATINDGSDGSNGKDGTSVTHSWSGTTLTVTSASGTSSANLKGEKGDTGDTGAAGKDGVDGKDYVLTEADKAEIAGMVGDIAIGGTTTVLEWQDVAVDFSQYPNKYVQWTSGIGTSVKFVDYDTGGKFAVAKIPVSAGDKFRTRGRIFHNAPVWLVADVNNKVVQMGTKGSVVENSEDEFTVETGGAYLYINKNDQNNNGTGFQYLKKEVETTVDVPASVATSPIYNKKIVYDGDSICFGAGYSGGYAKIIANRVMGSYVNQAKGGARLTTKGSNSWHSVVDNLENLPTDGDLYCFEGGINDYWTSGMQLGTFTKNDFTGTLDETTVCGALESIFRYALTNFLGKPICFVITHKIQNTAYAANGSGNTFEAYHDAMVGICKKYSIPYYDAFEESGLNGWNTAQKTTYFDANDGIHPNEAGYKKYYVPQLIQLFERIMPVE